MKRLLVLSTILILLTGCSTQRYSPRDIGISCRDVVSEDDVGRTVTDTCLPVDTFASDLKYHKTIPAEYRLMKDLDEAMDSIDY